MSDNLKLLQSQVETTLDENGLPGSILAVNHKSFVKDILDKVGKYNGIFYQARKNGSGSYPTGSMSWEGNAMNQSGSFVIRVAKLTNDLNDIGYMLGIMSPQSLINFKDYVGRSTQYRFESFVLNNSNPLNIFYEITIESIPGNINYIYQNSEIVTACFSFFINPSTATAGVSSVSGDGVDNVDPNNPSLTFPDADEILVGLVNRITTISEADQISINQSAINSIVSSYSRRKAVIDIVDNTSSPLTENIGDRYILDFTGSTNVNWDGANPGDIVEFDGSIWVAFSPVEGWIAYLDTQNKDALYVDDGTPEWQIRTIFDTNAIHTDIANEFINVSEKLILINTDRFLIEDSENSFSKKFLSWTSIKSTLTSLFEIASNKQDSLTADGTGAKFPTVDATNAGLALKAVKTQIDFISGLIQLPVDSSYKLILKAPYAGTITETTTESISGTCTATFKINTTALGGTANSVSSTEESQTHALDNAFAIGDDIVLTVSTNATCVDMSFTIKFTKTLN
jgi:hypothetical protein